jgi:hypothetical protein
MGTLHQVTKHDRRTFAYLWCASLTGTNARQSQPHVPAWLRTCTWAIFVWYCLVDARASSREACPKVPLFERVKYCSNMAPRLKPDICTCKESAISYIPASWEQNTKLQLLAFQIVNGLKMLMCYYENLEVKIPPRKKNTFCSWQFFFISLIKKFLHVIFEFFKNSDHLGFSNFLLKHFRILRINYFIDLFSHFQKAALWTQCLSTRHLCCL